MNTSPKKHRGPRPVNTLRSPQKPSFYTVPSGGNRPESATIIEGSSRYPLSISDGNSSLAYSDRDYTLSELPEIDNLGNSSSLFEDDHSFENLQTSTPRIRHTGDILKSSDTRKMVKEREAQTVPPRTDPAVPKALQDLTNTPPEFGKASPLRNPLNKDSQKESYSNLFNVPKPSQPRAEHHRAPQQPFSRPPPQYNPGGYGMGGQGHSHNSQRPSQSQQAFSNSGARPPHSFKHVPPLVGARYSTASAGSDIVEIPAAQFQPKVPYQGYQVPRPVNPTPRTIQPAARPVYSAMGQATGFQPVNGFNPLNPHGSRQTTIVSDPAMKRSSADDDDDFDPDTAIRAEGYQFGAPDPYAYVDASKANENIKHLLEGALDDDEERIPRTRGRKKKKQQQEEDGKKSLADKLASLDVKEDEKVSSENEGEDEEDDGSVEGMKVKLLPHQVDGVAWMIEKETGAHMKRVPPKGGLLADDMGLGKTIQSLALILSNSRPEKDAVPENKKNKILDSVGKGTLIVAPLALIKQWESEINTKVTKSHALKVLVYHGPSRTKSIQKLKDQDVVITTYQVLASEHGNCGEGPDGLKKGCFAVYWYRVILDEAHTIKNRNAKMTKACYDIRSHYRWCLTGTPMQNNLDELQSLIKFLNIKPYCDMSNWKDSIMGPMKNGRGNLAMRRLQIFLKTFMKRRTKDVLKKDGALNFGGKGKDSKDNGGFQIVARNVETVIGSFTAKERAFYNRLSDRAQARIDEMMGGEKADYIGALVLLLRLRQACNHPNLTKSNVKDDKDALTTGQKSGAPSGIETPRKAKDTDADDLADLLGGLSVQTKRCDICQTALTRNNAAAGAIRCEECEEDLNASQKVKKHKKHRKHKSKNRKHKDKDGGHKSGNEEPQKHSKGSRRRRVIVDSDDDDAQSGEWLVPEDQWNAADLGKAGGSDDENAEGGGDTLGSIDSDSFASDDEGTPSKKKQEDSFIVHDTDSEDEAPIVRQKLQGKKKVIDLVSDDDSDSDEEETDSEADTEDSDVGYDVSDLEPSTKIRQLLSILEKETPGHKVIVFSQFTSMLNLIEPFLRREGYIFTRYDGSMRNDLREASLHKLRTDKRTRVLLCSLKCGSLGLNLTAASRVVIMEPFWNPFVEEQAIDRVHRLNQTVDVTVYRLSIHDSVEERILDLQEAKRKLAAAALEGGKAMGKLTMRDMLALFKRDAEYDPKHVDDGSDGTIFARTRVLESPVKGAASMFDSQRTGEPDVKRKAGSLGLKKAEDSVWGRR